MNILKGVIGRRILEELLKFIDSIVIDLRIFKILVKYIIIGVKIFKFHSKSFIIRKVYISLI